MATLFLGDLSILCHENDLEEAFFERGYRPARGSIKIMRNGLDHHPRGYGFVSFETMGEAMAAMKDMDGLVVHGRKLRIKFAARKQPDLTPLTCADPIHSVHVKFITRLTANFDGAWRVDFFVSFSFSNARFPTPLPLPSQRGCLKRFSVRTSTEFPL